MSAKALPERVFYFAKTDPMPNFPIRQRTERLGACWETGKDRRANHEIAGFDMTYSERASGKRNSQGRVDTNSPSAFNVAGTRRCYLEGIELSGLVLSNGADRTVWF
jgi:hypothetical protein